ncbi:hypothetical protein ACTFRO_23760 [Bacillus cereus group sp. MYBK163-2]|uniref:hypothetical protein n=1 Tax=Bacillus cereus group sp. MYBK163-2 TaxID=3450675 RepID=UPI003F7A60B1
MKNSKILDFTSFNPIIKFEHSTVTDEYRKGDSYICFDQPNCSKVTIDFMIPINNYGTDDGKLILSLNHCRTSGNGIIDMTLNGKDYSLNYKEAPRGDFGIQNFEIPYTLLKLKEVNTFEIKLKSFGPYWLSDIGFKFETLETNEISYHVNGNISGALYYNFVFMDSYRPGLPYLLLSTPQSKCKITFFIPQKYRDLKEMKIYLNHRTSFDGCIIDMDLNGDEFYVNYKDTPTNKFVPQSFIVPTTSLNLNSANTLVIKLSDSSPESYCLADVTLEMTDSSPTPNIKMEQWMKEVPDYTRINNINLIGTHDSAAINKVLHTFYACQDLSITDQLNYGIRLLDVRLKIKRLGEYDFEFVTCHGPIKYLYPSQNEYQSFDSLLQECKDFLMENSSEFIVMKLQIDDWNNVTKPTDKKAVIDKLHRLLIKDYPIYSEHEQIPILENIRGQIFVLNKIDESLRIGLPIKWNDNTPGETQGLIYVQDKYEKLTDVEGCIQQKLNLVVKAFSNKTDSNILINFASAITFFLTGVYIHEKFLNYFGKSQSDQRINKLGWVLFDYPFTKYMTNSYEIIDVVTFIISSNFKYKGFEKTFVIEEGFDF